MRTADTSPVAGVVFAKSGTGSAPPPERIASFLGVDLLGHVPGDQAVSAPQDAGRPALVHSPESRAARAYTSVARRFRSDRSSTRIAALAAADGGRDERHR